MESLEDRSLLSGIPIVSYTTPHIPNADYGIAAGLDRLKFVYDQPVVNGADAANFELREAGNDGVFDTSDDVIEPLTKVTYNAPYNKSVIRFSEIPAGEYRVQVYDGIGVNDSSGFVPLDGDRDGNPGGTFTRTFEILSNDATKFELSGFPSQTETGESHSLTVTALDPYGNVVTGYEGTVSFTSNDQAANLPSDYTFSYLDAGSHTFSVTLNSPGNGKWVKATDVDDGFFISQTGITVTNGNTNNTEFGSYSFDGYPSPTEAGTAHSFTLSAFDASAMFMSDYEGTVAFASSDPLASMPSNYTFGPSDNGDKTFSTTFKTAGTQSLSATDLGSGLTSTMFVTVHATELKKFEVSGYPSPTVAGTSHDFDVVAVDTYGNKVSNYNGTVSFTSSDTNATLPSDYTFTSSDQGSKTFNATLRNTGSNRSITATDAATGKFGRQSGIVV